MSCPQTALQNRRVIHALRSPPVVRGITAPPSSSGAAVLKVFATGMFGVIGLASAITMFGSLVG